MIAAGAAVTAAIAAGSGVAVASTTALHRDGYEVSTAADGTTALDTLLRNRHEAVVLDILMPEPGRA
jgi:DNA-binding response OmpR family regulator